MTSRNTPAASASPVVRAIVGNALTSGAPMTSARSAMPVSGRGAPASSTTTGTATATSNGGCTSVQKSPSRRTQATASRQPTT